MKRVINDIKISKNFKLSEFESTDTKEVKINPKLLDKLQKIRDYLGIPLVINSGYRTKERNKEVGGASKSQHLEGNAVDISVLNLDIDSKKLAQIAVDFGFDGIGIYDEFVHLDVRGYFVIWDERTRDRG